MKIQISRILCPVDFSENSNHALQYAVAFAAAHEAQLEILHVLEVPPYPLTDFPTAPQLPVGTIEEMREAGETRLAALATETQQLYGSVTSRLVVGAPHQEIVEISRSGQIDLIVMGTHGRTGLAHMLLGSVTEKVVRRAPCPVLIVKHPEHEFVVP